MTKRFRAREVALQLLFQRDANADVPRPIIRDFVRGRLRDDASIKFCLSLYDGVLENIAAIDAKLTATAENWRLPRMANVDRSVLRLGAYELLFPTEDAPAAVALDEAIELARRYGSEDSPSFVNGILDKINKSNLPQTIPEPSVEQSEIPTPPSEVV